MTPFSDLIRAVIIFALAAAAICFVLGLVIEALDRTRRKKESRGDDLSQHNAVDLTGLAALAEALTNLNPSGRFLILSVAFTAIAAAAAGAGSIATAVA